MSRRVRKLDGTGLKIGGGTAENVVKTWINDYYNFTDNPEMAVYSWKESPGHDSNQMRPTDNAAGMGVYCKPRDKSHWWESKSTAYYCWWTAMYFRADLKKLTPDGHMIYANGTTSQDPTKFVGYVQSVYDKEHNITKPSESFIKEDRCGLGYSKADFAKLNQKEKALD